MKNPDLVRADPGYRDPITEAIKGEIDRTLLRENLNLTPQQRLEKGQAAMRFALSLREAGRRAEDKLFPASGPE